MADEWQLSFPVMHKVGNVATSWQLSGSRARWLQYHTSTSRNLCNFSLVLVRSGCEDGLQNLCPSLVHYLS